MNPEVLRFVAGDLEFLTTWGPDIADPDIRRGSATLRRLLVEDVYGAAWRAMGNPKQPSLIAVSIDEMANPQDRDKIELALAWGVSFRGIFSATMMQNKGNMPLGAATPPIREGGFPGEKHFTLSEYLRSMSGLVGGRSFARREVIKYIANVRGGVHLSPKERKAEKKLVERLGKIEKRTTYETTDGLLVELVAIAQAVGASDDANRLVADIRAAYRS